MASSFYTTKSQMAISQSFSGSSMSTTSRNFFCPSAVPPRRAPACRHLRVQATISDGRHESNRRDILLATGALAASPLILPGTALADSFETKSIPVDNLSSFQRNAEKNAFQARVSNSIKGVLTPADAPDALRLLLHDAATYDAATETGGVNGSIIFDEELNRPENASLKPYVAKLKELKKAIDAEGVRIGNGPISWADLIVLAAKNDGGSGMVCNQVEEESQVRRPYSLSLLCCLPNPIRPCGCRRTGSPRPPSPTSSGSRDCSAIPVKVGE
eukprot:jgi/Botrbrau1/23530/Bobra.0141s0002.1